MKWLVEICRHGKWKPFYVFSSKTVAENCAFGAKQGYAVQDARVTEVGDGYVIRKVRDVGLV